MRRRLSTQVARSTSTPSWVSFSEMFRSMPDATITSMSRTYSRVAAVGFVDRRHAFAEIVERQQQPALLQRRAARMASSTVSPAMNRRAKLSGVAMPYFDASRLSALLRDRAKNSALDRRHQYIDEA